jgi:hypothetical protein
MKKDLGIWCGDLLLKCSNEIVSLSCGASSGTVLSSYCLQASG